MAIAILQNAGAVNPGPYMGLIDGGVDLYAIPWGVKKIRDYCFYGCQDLKCIGVPKSVESIGESAFSGCSSLESITIPEGVTSIGESAFSGCSSLESITIPEGVTSIGSNAFSGCTSLTSITIAKGVTSIGRAAFSGCSSITSITIPDSVTSIGVYAFRGCSSITSITIPDSVTSIGEGAFRSCSSLTSITVDKNNSVYHSEGNCLIETASKTLIAGCKNSVIPADSSVTSIGRAAFSGCSSITSITIPDSITSIGRAAFSGCTSLTSITVDENNSYYRSENNCLIEKASKTLLLGCGNDSADGSVTITIPEGVEKIEDHAFDNCNPTTYKLLSCDTVPTISDKAIRIDNKTCIVVPANLYNDFCESKRWKKYVEHFECDALGRVNTTKFKTYLDYEGIYDIYKKIKGNTDGIQLNEQHKYVRILSKKDEKEISVGGYIGWSGFIFNLEYTAPKYLVMKYRSKLAAGDEGRMTDYIEVWATTDRDSNKFKNTDKFSVHVQRDGRWHTIVLDVKSSLGENAQYTPGSTLGGFRIDVFNQQDGKTFATSDSYFDIAYVGMCGDRNNAIAADPDYSGAEFDCYDLSSMLCGDIKTPSGESYALIKSEVSATPFGMNFVHINAEINYSANDRGEVYSYIYREDAVLPNVGKYAAVLYTGLDVGENGGLVQVWKSSNNSNVNWQNPNQQIQYTACEAGKDGWRYGVAELSGTDYTEDVCRSVRFDYIDGYDKWNYGTYNVTLNIAFLKFFDNADEATEYCKAYMRKYGLLEET